MFPLLHRFIHNQNGICSVCESTLSILSAIAVFFFPEQWDVTACIYLIIVNLVGVL